MFVEKYTIEDISKWMLDGAGKVKLPAIHEAFANAVLTRTANIYRAFYNLFGIGEEG